MSDSVKPDPGVNFATVPAHARVTPDAFKRHLEEVRNWRTAGGQGTAGRISLHGPPIKTRVDGDVVTITIEADATPANLDLSKLIP